MCLYPSIIENPKYAKSNENSKRIRDYRLRWIQIPCGHCEECRRAKANEWRVRLMEEIKSNSKNITNDGKEIEVPKYFEIEDDKFGKIVFGEESFQGDMMKAEKQILEGTAAIKTLENLIS